MTKKRTKRKARKTPAPKRRAAEASRAKKGGRKIGRPKTREAPIKKRKVTKEQRKKTRTTRRKPETNKEEINNYFEMEERKWTPALTRELKMVFLRAYARHGIISDGTSAAGITYRTHYRWRKEDEVFHEDCKVAETMANDLMEREARRRAIEGFDRPVIYQGEITGTYTDYSDALMTTLMKGNRPEKYKERTQHSGSIGRPMTLDEETKEDVVSSILGMIKNKPDPKGVA